MKKDLHVWVTLAFGLVATLGVATVATEAGRSRKAEQSEQVDLRPPGSIGGRDSRSQVDPVAHPNPLDRDRSDTTGRLFGESRPRVNKAATLLKSAHYSVDDRQAMTYLDQVLRLEIPEDDPTVRKILFGAHWKLAELYAYAPAKRAHHLSLAARFTDDPQQQAQISVAIASLGGHEVAMIDERPSADDSFGPDESCADARAIDLFASGDRFENSLSIEPRRGHAWFALRLGDGSADGLRLRIETRGDDTELRLFGGCESVAGLAPIAYDDDGGPGLASAIDTGCLAEGTYYLRVAGWNGIAGVDNVTLSIEAAADCLVSQPDAFEPDDDRAHATPIGHDSAPENPAAPSPERAQDDIQAHSIFPAGDQDWVEFQLERSSLVRIRTACGFPTMFNDFSDCDNPPEFDTILTVRYSTPVTTYGLCNQSFTGVPGQIATQVTNACADDLDCDFNGNGIVFPEDLEDLLDPVPGLPACLPWSLFSAGQRPIDPVDNPLAFSDDVDAIGGDFGADLTLCLPRTRKPSPSLSVQADPGDEFNWYVQVGGWSPSGDPSDSNLEFEYEVYVQNLADCDFEQEPNDSLAFAAGDDDDDDDDDDLALDGTPRYGIWDFSATQPDNDYDLYRFDVDQASVVRFETDGYDALAVDTFIEIWVGPDEDGEFFLTEWQNDDISAFDRRSRLEAALVPACEAVGRECASDDPGKRKAVSTHRGRGESESEVPSAAYYLNVTSAFVQPNFPYELRAELLDAVFAEFEDFGDIDENPAYLAPGERAKARLDRPCDFDGYRFHLTDDAFVRIKTDGAGIDTSIQLMDCETHQVLACDDDSGRRFASAVEGCLPGGREYCVRVRAFSGFSVFDYEIEIEGGDACPAAVAPGLTYDGANACSEPRDATFNTFAGCDASLD